MDGSRAYVGEPRRRAMWMAGIALVLALPAWWVGTRWVESRWIREQRLRVESRLSVHGNGLAAAVNQRVMLTRALKNFVQNASSEAIFADHFDVFGEALRSSVPGVRALEVAPQGIVNLVYPATGNEGVLGQDLLHDPRPDVREAVARSVATRAVVLSGPRPLNRGGEGVVAYRALFRERRLWGFVVLALDVPPLLQQAALPSATTDNLTIALQDRAGRVFWGDATVWQNDPVVHKVNLPESNWLLAAVPTGGWGAAINPWDEVVVGLGLALVALLVALVYVVAAQHERLRRAVAEATVRLREELAQRERDTVRIAQLNRTYRMLSRINQAVVRLHDRQELFQEACRLTVEEGGALAAWISLRDSQSGRLTPVAWCGADAATTMNRAAALEGGASPNDGPSPLALRERRTVICRDLAAHAPGPHTPLCRDHSLLTSPIFLNGEGVGVFQAFVGEADFFDDAEIRLFEELTGDISHGLDYMQQEADRKAAQAALLRSETLLRATQSLARIGGWEYDVATGGGRWTDETYRIHGISPDHDPSDIGRDLDFFPPEAKPIIEAAFRRAVEEGVPYDLELPFQRADGQRIWVRTVARPIFEDGRVVRVMGNIMDITDRKHAQLQHEQLEEHLRQAQKMESIGRLAGGVAHDFNNLLSPILGYAEMLLLDMKPDDPHGEDVQEIHRAADRAKELTQGLLAFGRKQVLEMKAVNLSHLVGGFQKMLRRLVREDIEVEIHLAQPLGHVRADPGQLEQVLMNLVVNANDAMPGGGRLTVETADVHLDEEYAHVHADVAPGDYVALTVTDTGCGMDDVTMSQIFEPFFTTKERGKGTGLGLATVHGIVKQHGGHIWVYSEPGRGTTFKVYLQRADAAAPEGAAPAVEAATPRGEETVLVVEDEAAVRRLVVGMLSAHGYRVLAAGNAEEARTLAAEHAGTIHVLLTDVIIPGANGRQLFAELARARPGLRVIFMSGYTANVIAHHGILEEGVHFLQKPFTVRALTLKVREALEPA